MSNLSDLLPAGAGGKQVSFTADGAISQGDTVILQTDGTVAAVTATTLPETVGTPTVFESADSDNIGITFDSNSNKVVIGYRDNGNSGYGTAIVGTVSGTSISFGTPVVFESAITTGITGTFDTSSNKVVLVYTDTANSNYETAIVGTVSGTSISFGSPVVISTDATAVYQITFDSNENKVVIPYADFTNSEGKVVIGTVSGTSISFGSPVTFNSGGYVLLISASFDSDSNKVVIGYRDNANSDYCTAIVGTVSGTSISFGTKVVFQSVVALSIASAFDSSANKTVFAFQDPNPSRYGKAIVGTVSGTSISFGSTATFNSADSDQPRITFDSNANKSVIVYRDDGSAQYGRLVVGTVSGTSISFASPVTYEAASTDNNIATFDSNSNKVVIAYEDAGNSSYGTSVVFQNAGPESNLTDTNFIGIADAAISDTASGNITIKGGIASNGLSSLTPGSTYYVQPDGTLSTTSSSVTAGKALSATRINLDYSS